MFMRYRLRTLLILMAAAPPLMAWYCGPLLRRIMDPPQPSGAAVVPWVSASWDYGMVSTEWVVGVDDDGTLIIEPPP